MTLASRIDVVKVWYYRVLVLQSIYKVVIINASVKEDL